MINKEELIKKIKALAESGVGGEKENAQKLLAELMQKYDIKEEDIEDDVIKEFDIKLSKFYKNESFAMQILYSIVGKGIQNGKGFYSYIWNKRKRYFIKCTSAEFLEFEAKFKFFSYHFKKELERFYSAFIQANKIFPIAGNEIDRDKKEDLTKEDYAMLKLASHLEQHEYMLQIEGGKQ